MGIHYGVTCYLKVHFCMFTAALYFTCSLYFFVSSPIRSLIESGFGDNKRSDVRLYYGARNLRRMAYQVWCLLVKF